MLRTETQLYCSGSKIHFDRDKKGRCVGVDSILIELIGFLQDRNLLKQTGHSEYKTQLEGNTIVWRLIIMKYGYEDCIHSNEENNNIIQNKSCEVEFSGLCENLMHTKKAK